MQTKGGIRKRPQRRRGTLPILNPPAVTLQKLLYPGTPLCNLEAKDPAATLSLILDGGKNIHFGARQKRVRILVPLLVLGENLPLRPHPPLRSGDKPSSAAERSENAPTGPEQDQARDMPQAKAVYPSAFRGTVLASKGPSGDVLMA